MFKERIVMLGIGVALVAATVLLFSAFADSTAEAAKGGANSTASAGTLSVSPDPAPQGTDTLTINGSGFAANQVVMINVSGSFPGAEVTTDGTGAFSLTWTRWGGGFFCTGGCDEWVTAYKYRGHSTVALATDHFWVCATNPC